MRERLSLLLRSALYGLRGGFLVRPLIIALILGMAGAILSFAEEYVSALNAWIPNSVSSASRSPGRSNDPCWHRQFDHDRCFDHFRNSLDDPDPGLHAVFAAHPGQLRQGP